MSDNGFEVTGDSRCRVTGRMTFETASGLWEQSRRALNGRQITTVDLSGVTAVDSAGLALLLEWVSWARQQGLRLQFPGFPDKLRALARLSEVESLLGLEAPK
jgi:phospholipid transport system transporter-binding protein